ncbi:signal transduction histidine kinase [Leptolyngbya sp. Heron Island J]|uniref:sensor histidine kinase n=1 Tax=Leptolyngbya sp. Heron Island J TaxID=1385935 RepID=UPI0003B9A1A6|nr:sensor histidine kinase [Leptolyngbya sp. Heron Island J]ESA35546.1 signal transduction histidine kinase [Leptolyngbya sp. Heron Island J]
MLLNPPSRLSQNYTAARPLRLLLHIEWILLSMGVLVIITAMIFHRSFQVTWLELVLFGLIGTMGLYLPLAQLRAKILYTAAELSLFGILVIRCLDNPLMMRIIPLLGLVVIIRSCQLFHTRGRLVVAGITFGSHLFVSLTLGQTAISRNLSRLMSTPAAWQVSVLQTNAIILFTLALLFVFLLVDALLNVHSNQQKLEIAHVQLQQYALQVEGQAALQERNRIAREIHDSLGHSLTAQTILLENVLLFWEQDIEQAKSYLLKAKDSSYQALKDVSRAVAALRDSPQPDKPLQAAIIELVNKVCQSTAMSQVCEINITTSLSDELTMAAYRIVQEALTNVVKHAQANQLSVQLCTKPQSLYVQVLDNGKGFDPSKNTTGFGLGGMKERAIALGGTCQIWSAPGAGCRISVILPLSNVVGTLPVGALPTMPLRADGDI